MKKIIFFLLVTFMLTACGEECYNAPLPIVFEFVDDNGENLITNGKLNPFSIQDENQVGVQVTKTDDDRIVLQNVGLLNGTKNYTFYSPVRTFNFSIESSEFKGGCDGYQINKLTFTGIAIDVKDENGYYKIILK
ncbi:membrane lipoprotein lipid attachment site-containing protein [Chryseobacterium caseinilyticum]|uniref:Membrane lipoprotein lipid attachment site-containing protein n=1 Tax=Chryseobacterium caseinilyticum TaxID=2771428 RepID=A0ABR8Z8A5_9FLAO|nr:membrane lipoprotein lipid attachment site-containing protein [Chryseobacterium caseinilyticum]MBD8081496.1 membrane lipoprotein lipid attachment site-containing protein [Chryseobacterium caseinilyticum]